MDDGVVNPLSKTVGGASPTEATSKKAPEAFLDSYVSCTVIAHVEMESELVGLDIADRAIEVKVDEML